MHIRVHVYSNAYIYCTILKSRLPPTCIIFCTCWLPVTGIETEAYLFVNKLAKHNRKLVYLFLGRQSHCLLVSQCTREAVTLLVYIRFPLLFHVKIVHHKRRILIGQNFDLQILNFCIDVYQ